MTEIVLAERFGALDLKTDIEARGIKFLGVDVENVLTDYGHPEVFPEAKVKFDELQTAVKGLEIVLLTNKSDRVFLDEVVSQLPGDIEYLGPSVGMKKKPSPEMFLMAIHDGARTYNAEESAMVDDQFKAWIGAKRAGYSTFFWTKPVGQHQHIGVRALRPVEFGLLRPVISLAHSAKEIRFGDW